MSSMSSVLCPRWKHWQRSRYINPCAVMWQVAVTVGRGPVIVWYWMCVSMLSAYYAAPSMVLAEAVVGSMKLFLVRSLPSGVQLREPDWVSVPGSAHRCSPSTIFMDANVDNVGSGGQNTSDMEHRQNKHPSWSTGIFHLCSTTTLAFIIPCFCQYMQVRLCPGHVEFHYCDSRLDFDEWLHHNVHSRYKTRFISSSPKWEVSLGDKEKTTCQLISQIMNYITETVTMWKKYDFVSTFCFAFCQLKSSLYIILYF